MATINLVPAIVYNVIQFGADNTGASDATTDIQNAINAAQAAGGGTVYFPAGTYTYIPPLIVSTDNIELVGASWGAQLKATSAGGGTMLQVQGPGGAGNFRYGIRIANLFFNGNSVASLNGLDLVSTYGAQLEHLRIRNVTGINVHWDGISGAFGAYNYMNDCHITDGGSTAVGVQTDSSEWLTIKGGQFGFFFGGTAIGVNLQNLNNRIIGTSFDRNDIGVQLTFAGRNIVQGCQFDRGSTYFIYMKGTVGNLIEGNEFCTSSGGADIIRVDSSQNSNNLIKGNICSSTGWTNFVNEIAATGGTIPNIYEGNQTNSYAVIRQTGIFRANQGYNPQGAASITVTASPFTYTAGATPETVYISGGTVSVVAKNSITLFTATNCNVNLEPGEAVTVTYSVAPTMNKDRH